jgi:hypothetical protein
VGAAAEKTRRAFSDFLKSVLLNNSVIGYPSTLITQDKVFRPAHTENFSTDDKEFDLNLWH